MIEDWKMHPVHKDYEVSTLGRVRRLTPSRGTRVGKVLKKTRTPFGYESVAVGKDRVFTTIFVHVLVLETFVGPRPEGQECLHDNDVKHDNVLTNLKWGTHSENYADRVRHGGGNHGSRHGMAKLTEDQVIDIRLRHETKKFTQKEIAKAFSVSRRAVRFIVTRQRWANL